MSARRADPARLARLAVPGAALVAFAVATVGLADDPAARLRTSRLGVALALLGAMAAAWRHRRALRRRVAAFFFHVDDPLNLAFTRLVVFSVIATYVPIHTVASFAQLPSDVVRMPIGMGWALPWMPRTPESAIVLGEVMRVSAAAAALGFVTPLSTWLAALSSCFFLVIPHMFGHVGHDRHHLVWFALLLAASPCGDRLSVDAALRAFRRRRAGVPAAPPAPAPRYGFPRRCMLLTMGVAYFFAGFWKLAAVGVDWFRTDNLAYLAAKLAWAGVTDLGANIAAHTWLMRAGAFGTIGFELGFLFALFSRWGRVAALGGAFVFHAATFVFLGISFGSLLYCYVGLLDVAGALRPRRDAEEAQGLLGVSPEPRAPSGTPGTRPRRPSLPAYAVAVVVLGGNLLFGVLRIGDGWPFACYPRFDVLQTSLFTSYVIEGETASGTPLRLHDGELGGPLGRHFYNIFRATQARVGGVEQADGREPRWRALCTFAWGHDPRLRGARTLRFVLEDVDVAADRGRGRVVDRRLLFPCTPPPP